MKEGRSYDVKADMYSLGCILYDVSTLRCVYISQKCLVFKGAYILAERCRFSSERLIGSALLPWKATALHFQTCRLAYFPAMYVFTLLPYSGC